MDLTWNEETWTDVLAGWLLQTGTGHAWVQSRQHKIKVRLPGPGQTNPIAGTLLDRAGPLGLRSLTDIWLLCTEVEDALAFATVRPAFNSIHWLLEEKIENNSMLISMSWNFPAYMIHWSFPHYSQRSDHDHKGKQKPRAPCGWVKALSLLTWQLVRAFVWLEGDGKGYDSAEFMSRVQWWHLVNCTIHHQRISKLLCWIFLVFMSAFLPWSYYSLFKQLPARTRCNNVP